MHVGLQAWEARDPAPVLALVRITHRSREAFLSCRKPRSVLQSAIYADKVLPGTALASCTACCIKPATCENLGRRAQGREAADARLQRAPGGMWVQDTTLESRRRLVASLPQVRASCGAGLCAA